MCFLTGATHSATPPKRNKDVYVFCRRGLRPWPRPPKNKDIYVLEGEFLCQGQDQILK